jgi:hypothetical protein
MASNNENRDSRKTHDREERQHTPTPEHQGNRNLSGNTAEEAGGSPEQRVSTAGDTSNPKGSGTDLRKEEKEDRPNYDGTADNPVY